MNFKLELDKRVVAVLVGLVLAIIAVGVVVRVINQEEEAKPYAYVHEQQGNSWYALHELGFLDACEDFDVPCVIYADDSRSASGKLDLCERMLADGGTAGFQATVHDNSFDACLNRLDAPFVNTHGMYDESDTFIARITPDIEGYSEAAAHEMAKVLGGEGKVIITQNAFNAFENLVAETFCNVVENEYDMECTESVETGAFPDGVVVATALLQRHPDAKGSFGTNSFAPLIWMNALRDAGYEPGEIVVIGMDPVEENLDAIKSGWVHAIVAQPGYEENYEAIRTLIAYNNGEGIVRDHLIPAPVITIDGIGPYYEMVERVKEQLNR
jgi:ribose transport system substrate-binding protein